MFRPPHHVHAFRAHHRDAEFDPRTLRALGDWFGPRRGRRPGVKRGDVRPLILRALRAKPMHGYQVIQELEAQSGGRWRPSAGSVYPTLQQLEDEGLVHSAEVDGRRTYELTADGRAAADEAAPGPWRDPGRRSEGDLRRLAVALIAAAAQVERAGSPETRRQAQRVLVDARRSIYRLLADDLGETEAGDDEPPGVPA
ncbi:MAG TPA: PadR family transcriptional regulator [Candidatus Limnocylindrales bacterium]|nr:PadR family transcriptional regulator [Candidatus Limnocylindrales bacterium]